MAPNLQSCWHRPQPTQRVGSMAALPLKTMAGQPICMQALQLLHLS